MADVDFFEKHIQHDFKTQLDENINSLHTTKSFHSKSRQERIFLAVELFCRKTFQSLVTVLSIELEL